jgi:hypothetical protein
MGVGVENVRSDSRVPVVGGWKFWGLFGGERILSRILFAEQGLFFGGRAIDFASAVAYRCVSGGRRTALVADCPASGVCRVESAVQFGAGVNEFAAPRNDFVASSERFAARRSRFAARRRNLAIRRGRFAVAGISIARTGAPSGAAGISIARLRTPSAPPSFPISILS